MIHDFFDNESLAAELSFVRKKQKHQNGDARNSPPHHPSSATIFIGVKKKRRDADAAKLGISPGRGPVWVEQMAGVALHR